MNIFKINSSANILTQNTVMVQYGGQNMVISLNTKAKRMQKLDFVYKTCYGPISGEWVAKKCRVSPGLLLPGIKRNFWMLFSKLNTFYGIFY